MTRPIAMARFDHAWPLAGGAAVVASVLGLGLASLAVGLPFWMPLNATSHALHGPEAAQFTGLDLAHTGLGAAIHVAACFFWAAVAVLMLRDSARGGAVLAWFAGLATAALAGVVDFALMPARLSPGWELVLPPAGVMAGLASLGIGLAMGLWLAHGRRRAARRPSGRPNPAGLTPPERSVPERTLP